MKKTLKISGIVILAILLLLIATPILFKKQIYEMAKVQINKRLNAEVGFSDLKLSFLKNFPNASIVLKDFYVAGIEIFEDDTLLQFKALDIRVDLMSVIKMENIQIKGVLIDHPSIKAKKLASGQVNWDIMKEAGEPAEESIDTLPSTFTTRVALKKFEIRKAQIVYLDDSAKMAASLSNYNFLMRGDLGQDFTTLSVTTGAAAVNYLMGGIRYIKDASFNAKINLDADLKNAVYTIKDNTFKLNDLLLSFEGSVAMPENQDMMIDLTFSTRDNDFKSLLSMVPAIYMKDFETVKTTGQLSLNGAIKGNMNDSVSPNASLKLRVENAMFKYPDLPKTADNIQLDVDLFYDGTEMDNTTIDVNRFHANLGGNPVDLALHIKTPESDMNISGLLKTNLDLETLADVIPLESTTLKGSVKSDLDFMGYLSYIEKEQYEKFKADGSITLAGFEYNSPDLPKKLIIKDMLLLFSARFVEVRSFNAEIGKSDIQLIGRVENFIPYVFKDGTIKGSLDFHSRLLDLNELMAGTSNLQASETADTTPMSVFEVPRNIDFRLVSGIGKIFYDKLEIDNTAGTISIRNGKVLLENLSMNMLQGSLKLNGEYHTENPRSPFVDFGLLASGIDIPSAFYAFTTVQQFAPIARLATGRITLDMQFSSFLDEEMEPVMNTIIGRGSFASDNIAIVKSETFNRISGALKTKAFDNLALENVNVKFEIKDGRVSLEPFETKMGNTGFVIGGDQGLDQTMNYAILISAPQTVLGTTANEAIYGLYSQAAARGVNITPSESVSLDVKVTGTFTDPKISLSARESVKQGVAAIKEELMEKAREEVEKKKEEVKATISEEALRLIAQAEREASQIREKAREAAETIKNEADINATRLVSEAKNPVTKKAAEIAANKMRQEANDKANLIIKEGDDKADKIILEARQQVDKL